MLDRGLRSSSRGTGPAPSGFALAGSSRCRPDVAATAIQLLVEAGRLRAERNRFAHAVLVMDPEWTGDSAPWLLKEPKGGELALLDSDRRAALAAEAGRLGNSLRTPEPSCRRGGCAARGATPRERFRRRPVRPDNRHRPPGADDNAADNRTADEYERIVKRLPDELAPRSRVLTEQNKRDVRVRGRSTTNQIDVL